MHYGFFDGATALKNPGNIGIGFCIYREKTEIAIGAGPSGFGSNNEAEYKALVWLLEKAVEIGIKEMTVLGDSQLIIRQVKGEWNASEKFTGMINKARSMMQKFDYIHIDWIPREKNVRADALSKRGLELKQKSVFIKGGALQESTVSSSVDILTDESEVTNKLHKTNRPDETIAPEVNRKSAPSKTTAPNKTEVRIGKKFAVVISENAVQHLINLKSGRCSCGEQRCKHLTLVGVFDAELKSA